MIELAEDEYDDYEDHMYEYFEDIEYGNDDYFDQEEPLEGEDEPRPGDKRKAAKAKLSAVKRNKVLHFDYNPVSWIPSEEAYSLDDGPGLVDRKELTSYALIPDWRKRFKNAHGFSIATEIKSLEELDAAMLVNEEEGEDEDEDEGEDEENRAPRDQGLTKNDDDWEDEEEEDDDENMESGLDGLDPDILKSILAAKLADSGMGGADQGAFMESIMQMLSKGGAANDDMLESLTSTILGQASEEGADSSTTKWLSQQGVSLTEHEEEKVEGDGKPTTERLLEERDNDDKTGEPAHQTPAHTPRQAPDITIADDGVANSDRADNLYSTFEPLPPTTISAGQTPDGPADSASKKRKKVTFAPPHDKSFHTEDQGQLLLTSELRNKRPRREAVASEAASGKLKSIKSRPGPDRAIVADGSGNAGTTGVGELAVKDRKFDPRADKDASKATTRVDAAAGTKVTASLNTEGKKRKASDAPEADIGVGKPKRQLRGFAAPTASSQRKVSDPAPAPVAKKTTRSGRERK